MNYQVRIGLETHVQLKTLSKVFCGCMARFGDEPNTCVCPVCLGYPGAMPVLNEKAVRLTVLTGLMIGSRINLRSTFERKNYFYPDMPKNFQISQYEHPLCLGGGIDIDVDGAKKRVGITRIHLEEDVAKNMHYEQGSGVDFNRAGLALMEIVSEPDLHSPQEAMAFLHALKEMLIYGGISDCNLEQGNMRCDVNCSLSPPTARTLGVKTEIKNMNTFRGVSRALEAEIRRQSALLDAGRRVRQETLRWDEQAGTTVAMRSKEYAHDYRYFPEPDLPPVCLSEEQMAAWRAELPELPATRRNRLIESFGLPEYDATVLVARRDAADFFEEAASASRQPKAVSNWVMTELLRVVREEDRTLADLPLTPRALAELVDLVDEGVVTHSAAKEVFAVLIEEGGSPKTVIERLGMSRVRDEQTIDHLVDEVLADHADVASDYRGGKHSAIQFLVGQVMRRSRGRADPRLAGQALQKKLDTL